VSFVGYMDWSIYFFYDNLATPFTRIVKADYAIYRLNDMSIGFSEIYRNTNGQFLEADYIIAHEPILVGAHRGYNVVKYLDKYYGVAQSLGALDLSEESDRNTAGIIVVDDLETLTGLIDKAVDADDSFWSWIPYWARVWL